MSRNVKRIHDNYCSNGYTLHSWKIVSKTSLFHPDEEKRYRVCKICDEERPMWVKSCVKDSVNVSKQSIKCCLEYQPLDDLDEYINKQKSREPLFLWKLILKRVRQKLNPINLENEKTITCKPNIDLCVCHGLYKHMCPLKDQNPTSNNGVLSWEKTKHIDPLKEPWCDIPLPIGPRRKLMTSSQFYEKWNTIHGKALDYLKYYSAFSCLPPMSVSTETPKFLIDNENDILEGEFIQLKI